MLFRSKVKTLRAQMQRAGAAWTAAGEGWEVREARLRLSGWSRERRVVLVRETPARAPVGEHARRRRDTFAPAMPGAEGWSQSPAARPPTSLPVPLRLLGPGPAGSPCSSPPSRQPPTPPSRSPGSIANAPTPNRAERDSQRAEPLPEGQRRRALAKHLRRTQEPMGLVRLHHAAVRPQPAHGQLDRAG